MESINDLLYQDTFYGEDVIEAFRSENLTEEEKGVIKDFVFDVGYSNIDDFEACDDMLNVLFVRESHFPDYAREIAEDNGLIPESNDWPAYCIDWEYAARELKHDYNSADLAGITYYYN